ncbi:MAG: hypothetical protein DMG67_07600 [Acidobacteria bacterium]|nr:MAG: hypothetical protein DMG67_07600 [Acidobacteriota bacterium]
MPGGVTMSEIAQLQFKENIMKQANRTVLATLALSLSLAVTAQMASAQIGSGWTQIFPSSNIQVETHDHINQFPGASTSIVNGGGRYSNSGGVETFQLVNTTSNRVERRYRDEYSSGTRQFQADITISTPSNNESIHQIFNGPTGPWLIVREENLNGGSVRMGGGTKSGLIATGLYGKSFRLNSINNVNTRATRIYINGSLVWTGTNPGGTFYTKYGCYGTLGAASAKIQFRHVKMFSGGHF